MLPCYSETVSFDFQLAPMPFYQRMHTKPCQALNLCFSDSPEKHCFNLIFLDISIRLRFEPYTQLLWPEIEAKPA